LSKIKHLYLDSGASKKSNFFRSLAVLANRRSAKLGLSRYSRLLEKLARVTDPVGAISSVSEPLKPVEQNCPDLSNGSPLTVISANLWHDWPRHRQLLARLAGFARLVEDEKADLVLLQEVAHLPDLHIDDWLAERLGMAYVFSRANGHRAIGFEEGLAIFSRYSLCELHLRQLDGAANPFVHRLALGAHIDTPCGELLAFSIHLGLFKHGNAIQLRKLRQWVGELAFDQPVLIGGDFNAHESSRQIRQVSSDWTDTYREIHPSADGTTHTLRGPLGVRLRRRRLDYIFFHPGKSSWSILEARHITTPGFPHSDHQAVLTRLAPLHTF
jgi:endonuclease/exonuclease/phosphatase family metal-dependent hydrolase